MEYESGRTSCTPAGHAVCRFASQRAHVGELGGRLPQIRRADPAHARGARGDRRADPVGCATTQALGARDVTVTGSLKFDLAVPDAMVERGAALRTRCGRGRPVWLAASTRDGEEALLLDAMAQGTLPADALLLLVPSTRSASTRSARWSRPADSPVCVARATSGRRATRVVLGDSLGEMLAYCAAADVAFVGGSLLPLGGQNLLEPIAVGVPTLVGPHTFNFAETTSARSKPAPRAASPTRRR